MCLWMTSVLAPSLHWHLAWFKLIWNHLYVIFLALYILMNISKKLIIVSGFQDNLCKNGSCVVNIISFNIKSCWLSCIRCGCFEWGVNVVGTWYLRYFGHFWAWEQNRWTQRECFPLQSSFPNEILISCLGASFWIEMHTYPRMPFHGSFSSKHWLHFLHFS